MASQKVISRVLYISYDGMTDNLGQSQVIPYLIGLTKKGLHFDIISCEKADRFVENETRIRNYLTENNIGWFPVSYTKKPPVLSTIIDVLKISKLADKLYKQNAYDAVHCRSYIPSLIGLSLKKKHKLKFIFDMRGFWADERVDGNLWKLNNPLFKLVYRFFKQKELEFLSNADAIVSLTNAGKNELLNWNFPSSQKQKISVIPCCADFTHFKILTKNQQLKSKLGFNESDKILGYLGSLGTWYMLDEMLKMYKVLSNQDSNLKFLFITPEPADFIFEEAAQLGIEKEKIKVIFSHRNELPEYISVIDFSVSFIKPSYSKLSSSPTKMGELFACGIPIICNGGVGDVEEYITKTNGGICIKDFSKQEYQRVALSVPLLMQTNKEEIRNKAYELFSLEKGVEAYYSIYNSFN